MKTKEMKGITLVALVVTIVVLLILAAVSINLVLGDNGIIKKANQAASVTKEAEVKEAINRTILEFYLTNDYETLEDFLKAKAEDGSIDSVSKNADGTLTIRKGDYSVTVENKTNSLGGSGSGGSTGGETQTPEITIGEAKVVANSDGTGDALGEASTYLENTLYITFTHSITEGTTTVEPDIPYAVTANGTYKFTVTGTVNGKSYTKEVNVTVNQFKNVYEYMQKNTEVTYPDGKKVWIPEGFKIADDSSEDVQGGVVIEDKEGNQFVWVPVDTIDAYKRIGWIDVGSVPYQWYLETLEDDEKKSVDTYKGFYIGRYEAGDKESTEAKKLSGSNDVTKTVTIKKGQAPYNYVKKTQAVSLAEGFAKQQKYSETIKTKLLSSYAWDTALAFIKKTVNDYPYSSPQGNYMNTKFEYIDITGESKSTWGIGVLMPTGLTMSVCNIYDMGGNVEEWTTEKYSPGIKIDIVNPDGSTSTSEKSYYNVCRGGYSGFMYSGEPGGSSAGCRRPNTDEAARGQNIEFRIALFL